MAWVAGSLGPGQCPPEVTPSPCASLPAPGPVPAQVVRDQMRQVQHRLQQERLRDARPFQGVPHRVFPLCGLQPPAYPRGRVRAAGGRALLPRGPRRGGESQPGRRRPTQPSASGAAAANGRYSSARSEGGPAPGCGRQARPAPLSPARWRLQQPS